jgi:hypothetical protein
MGIERNHHPSNARRRSSRGGITLQILKCDGIHEPNPSKPTCACGDLTTKLSGPPERPSILSETAAASRVRNSARLMASFTSLMPSCVTIKDLHDTT